MLPQFDTYTGLFWDNDSIKHVLCVFYQDILDYYATLLHFLHRKSASTLISIHQVLTSDSYTFTGWKMYFDSIWPRYAGKTNVIRQNIGRHRLLIDREVTQPYIAQAMSARLQEYKIYEESHKTQYQQKFVSIKSSLELISYDKELEDLTQNCMKNSGQWLTDSDQFLEWSGSPVKMKRVLWIQGIPGAG